MLLTPREQDKMMIYQVAELARRRQGRGLKLNVPESIALICEAVLEAARDGKTVPEATSIGEGLLSPDDVMDGVREIATRVQVEATFKDGTQLVTCVNPISGESKTS
ncbi:urease subunit gamma [Streptomyces sp. NPDC052043]|uniref:urease subunit gamma n=1 Tax=Streptomyces sp. NPDC052043 TaxID=3365684 RepID=UPI0037D01BAD